MRLRVRHEARYAFAEPVREAMLLVRATPRATASQFVKRWRIEIGADARLDKGEDAFGNITHTVFVDGPVDDVQVTVEGEVETAQSNGVVTGAFERLPRALFLRETPLTRIGPEVRAFGRAAAAAEGGDRLAALHRMMGQLRSLVRVPAEPSPFDAPKQGAAETLARGAGSAVDQVHVFIAAARSLAVPARCVSGYMLPENASTEDASRVWAEAFVERVGWIGFDIALGLCASDHHVRVAAAPDALDVRPLRSSHPARGSDNSRSLAFVAAGRHIVEE
jgi:transglutaminase-like putative cysteine protease